MLLTCGAMGIRTPDLLHAITRQHIHHRPSPQVTVPRSARRSPVVRVRCGTFLLYSPGRPHESRDVAVLPPAHSRSPSPAPRKPERADAGSGNSARSTGPDVEPAA
jgi:hypothetical protein